MAKKRGIDKNVYVFLWVFILLLVLIVVIRFATHKKCPNIGYTISTDTPIAGQSIAFEDTTKGATTWDWDLGDKQKHQTARSFTYTYYEAGTYTITLTINNCPPVTRKITVQPAVMPAPDTVFNINPVIEGPKTAIAGRKVQFFDKTEGSTSSQWEFENGNQSTEKNPFYTFTSPGKKTITLIVNGKSQQGRWEVVVTKDTTHWVPKPGVPKPSLPPKMSESEMSMNLMKVAKRILSPNFFQTLMCNGMDIPVMVNGKTYTFIKYCSDIRVQAPTNITVTDIKYDSYNCPTSIVVQEDE